MLQLTLQTKKNGVFGYSTDEPHLQVIGEFLTMDVLHMPDFMRGFITSLDDEHIKMDACSVTTSSNSVIIKHLDAKDLPIVTLPKERVLEIIELWEDFIHHQRPTQWVFFKEHEFGLPEPTDELSKKWEEMEKEVQAMIKKQMGDTQREAE